MPQQQQQQHGPQSMGNTSMWSPQLYQQWFGAITEGRSIQVHSILADHPDVLNMRRREPTPFHMALTHIASEWLGNDTSGMDGLQVAIMGYKNAYANWRLGNGAHTEQMAGMSADQMKEHVAVREVILGALIDAITPEQLDSHFFGRQQNSTLHLAAFYNDANLVERLLRQGAAVDIPNHMGFLPAGITNEKSTLHWLSMYRGQVRGSRYQLPLPQQDDARNYYGDAMDDAGHHHLSPAYDPIAADMHHASAIALPHGGSNAHLVEAELEMEMLDQLSDDDDDDDDGAPTTSYIRRFGEATRDMQPGLAKTALGENNQLGHEDSQSIDLDESDDGEKDDDVEDDRHPDNASVGSCSDRGSLGLGLGASRSSLTKKSPESTFLRQRVSEGGKSQSRDDGSRSPSRGLMSMSSLVSDAAYSLRNPQSSTPSMVSYHTASGLAASEQAGRDMTLPDEEIDLDDFSATVRVKVDPSMIDDDQIDDIFSDSDDVVQLEPSYCNSGSGLSASNDRADKAQSPLLTRQPSLMSSLSSSGSITMRSLSNALALASATHREAAANSAVISAFPVVMPDVSLRSIHEFGKPSKATDQLRQQESLSKDSAAASAMQRAASPFLLRDSLYEMIMGRSPSRQSGASLAGSVTSNTVSNGSTFGSSKDNLSVASSGGGPLRSPTSPTTHISPTSTSFDDSTCSPSHTAISSPTADASFANSISAAAQMPEMVPEEGAETATGSFAEDVLPASATLDTYHPADVVQVSAGATHDVCQDASVEEDMQSVSPRAASPVAGPRPTASSLFAVPASEPASKGLAESAQADGAALAYLDAEHERAPPIPRANNDSGEQFPPPADVAFKAGRIGRRQGRAAAEYLHDDLTGFSSEPTFNFYSSKHSSGSLGDRAATTDASEAEPEPESPAIDSPPPDLPADAPLTRDKRDQYLQTLISRNTMRGGLSSSSSSPSKRTAHSGIAGVMRAASPAWSVAASDAAAESGEDGDIEAEAMTPPFGSSFRNRHIAKRSEGSIEFAAGSRSPSSLGMRDRSLEPETRIRPPSSLQHAREALAVSGASINGRMRAHTMAAVSSAPPAQQQQQPLPTAAAQAPLARKISPSLAGLKTRSLVSNSPAKLKSGNSSSDLPTAASGNSPARVLALSSSRVRAMSTPPDSRPPSSLLKTAAGATGSGDAGGKTAAGKSSNANPARIGRVAALSQNFERQKSALPSHISIPLRPGSSASFRSEAGDKDAHLAVASAPLGGPRTDFSRPVARSSSISSSHSTGAHGQSTSASRGAVSESTGGSGNQHQQQGQACQQTPLPPPAANDGVLPGGELGAGDNGGNGGDGGGDKPSPNPRFTALEPMSTDSNGSTTSHSSSTDASRGLAASAHSLTGLSAALLDSHASVEIGSSIFSSTESGRDVASGSEPSVAHAAASTSRRDADAERKNRFKELANRRKSGTLERISNSGLVKSRTALLAASEPSSSMTTSTSSTSTGQSKSAALPAKPSAAPKVRFAAGELEEGQGSSHRFHDEARTLAQPIAAAAASNSAAGFFEVAGGGRRRREPGGDNVVSSSLSSAELDLDGLQQASMSASHPGDAHLLDTSSPPESTPLDSSEPENTKVGLLAQYALHQKRFDYILKRESGESEQSYLSSGQDSQFASAAATADDIEFGFRTVADAGPYNDDDQLAPEADDESDQEHEDRLTEEFLTLLPSRPRYNPRTLFGLSTVAEEEDESRNVSLVASDALRSAAAGHEPVLAMLSSDDPTQASSSSLSSILPGDLRYDTGRVPEMQERRPSHDSALILPPASRQLDVEALGAIRETMAAPSQLHSSSPPLLGQGSGEYGLAGDATHYDDLNQSRTPSLGSHSFDPSIVFGYNSEENSTMASRSSFDRSDIFAIGRPGSASSRVLYMHPMDQADQDGYSGDSELRQAQAQASSSSDSRRRRPASRWQPDVTGSLGSIQLGTDEDDNDNRGIHSSSSSSAHIAAGGKGKAPASTTGAKRHLPEMEQVRPSVNRLEPPATTVEAIEEDLSTDEELIPKILYIESQDFEGYRPMGFHIQEHREEMRKLRREKKEAAKRGITLPSEPMSRIVSPLWFMENNLVDPLPPDLLQMMLSERDMVEAEQMSGGRGTEHPELKRELETSSTISLQRLRDELDATMAAESEKQAGNHGTIKALTKRHAKRARKAVAIGMFDETTGRRKSFLDSVVIPVSDVDSDGSSDDSVERTDMRVDEAFGPIISQEFHVSTHELYRRPSTAAGPPTAPRKRLVLRAPRAKTFSERVMDDINVLDVSVRTDVHGPVRVRTAGRISDSPSLAADGTVRPAAVPRYVSALSGVPTGPFFQTPKAAATPGYLYMRILSIEDVEGKPDSVYFVIRNGIDTLATTPVQVAGATGTTVNQEFRILTDPSVSITMWMRFRSDAIVARRRQTPGCLPPLLRKLVRRNTRTRRGGGDSADADSLFDFSASRRGAYPERGTSAAYGDARSLGATQAPSSVFYEPGAEISAPGAGRGWGAKGLAQSRVTEDTRGVAVVHVGEMMGEVFLRGLVDSWDVENVWESKRGARLQLQLFFIPECPLFREDELPRTLSECEMAMEVCGFHNRTLNSGFMSQRGGDTRFWRRRYFRLVGGFLFAYHESSRNPRCFIDLNDATRVVDHADRNSRRPAPEMRSVRNSRRSAHVRSSSDHSTRRPIARMAPMRGHDYASDSEPPDQVDVADPALLQRSAVKTDSGIVSLHASDHALDSGIQHSFSIEFGEGGFIEFYTDSANEKRVWVEVVRRLIGAIPKIPSWLIKLLHADVSDRIGPEVPRDSESSLASMSNPSSRFHALAHPHSLH
ncbi:Bud site selection protein bud4 [Coemansia sp. RSA 2322]|nr:Bud site selection protein bud4 [Coemansia sp. RSA 2322]